MHLRRWSSASFSLPFLLVVLGVGLGASARADYAYCSYNFGPGTPGGPPEHTTCASSSAGAGFTAGSVTATAPDGVDSTSASTGKLATGDGGASSASASASAGRLDANVTAEMLTEPMPLDGPWLAIGKIQAAFYDEITIEGLAGVALGTPVKAQLVATVTGAFTGRGGNTASGTGADFMGSVYIGNTAVAAPLAGFYDYMTPNGSSKTDLAGLKTGDKVRVYWSMQAEAGVDGEKKLPRQTQANVTGTLFIDIKSGNARPLGTYGHDYAAKIIPPETDAGADAASPAATDAGDDAAAVTSPMTGAADAAVADAASAADASSAPAADGGDGSDADAGAAKGGGSSSCSVSDIGVGEGAPLGLLCLLALVCTMRRSRSRA